MQVDGPITFLTKAFFFSIELTEHEPLQNESHSTNTWNSKFKNHSKKLTIQQTHGIQIQESLISATVEESVFQQMHDIHFCNGWKMCTL